MKNLSIALFFLISLNGFSQSINLAKQLKQNKISVINRDISKHESNGIELSALEGDGLAILEAVDFRDGTIQLEIKGENNPGKSFVGLAFNIQNDSTYEAVYFRPFNFVAKEQDRRDHMVQYIYHPDFSWFRLRKERTGEFEAELKSAPDPDSWFEVKIIFTDKKVKVYVAEEANPVLEIERLASPVSNKIGLWVGNGSSGRFRNLSVK